MQNYGGTLTWVPYTGTPPTYHLTPISAASLAVRSLASTNATPTEVKLESGASYLLVVAKNERVPDLLAADNLLFIDQLHADDEGTVSVTYQPAAGEPTPYIALYGASGVTVLSSTTCDGGDNCPSAKFVDVNRNAWYHKAIDFALTNGIFSGMDDTHFNPNGKTTRAMFVTVLWRLDGREESGAANPFADVKIGSYYEKAVIWAAVNKIVAGTDATHFDPNGNVTREQVAAILYRYSNAKGYDLSANADLSKFPDASKISNYAKDNLAWAVGAGLISGSKDAASGAVYLDPKGNATRAQVAQILMMFTQKIAK